MIRSSIRLSFALLYLFASVAAAEEPKSADQALLVVMKGLSENKPGVIWDALPASYQKDVNDLARSAIVKVDAKLYDQVMSTASRVSKLLKDKKTFILAHPMMANVPNKVEVEKQWDPMVSMLNTILTSDIATHEKAKTLDVGKFLTETGNKVMGDATALAKLANDGDAGEFIGMISKFKDTKATLISESGDKAVVRIEAPGETPEEAEFTRVEGKWIPTEMAQGWSGMIAEGKAAIASMDEAQMKQAQQMATPMFGILDGLLGTLEKAQTQEEFNTVVNGIMQMLGGGTIR